MGSFERQTIRSRSCFDSHVVASKTWFEGRREISCPRVSMGSFNQLPTYNCRILSNSASGGRCFLPSTSPKHWDLFPCESANLSSRQAHFAHWFGSSSSAVHGKLLKILVAQCFVSGSTLDEWLNVEKVVTGEVGDAGKTGESGGGLGTELCWSVS